MLADDLKFKPDDFDGKVLDLDTDGDRKFVLCHRDAECLSPSKGPGFFYELLELCEKTEIAVPVFPSGDE